MKLKTSILTTFIAIVVSSCNVEQKSRFLTEVKIDFGEKKTVKVDDKQIVRLETSDNSLLFDLCNVEAVDSFYVIHSRNFLKLFDKEGKFVRNIGALGHAGKEYQSIANIFVHNNIITVYDFNGKSIISYDVNGSCKGRKKVIHTDSKNTIIPNHLYQTNDGYISVNAFGGSYRTVSCLSKTDTQMKNYLPISGRNGENGFFLPDDICLWNDKALDWQPLCDTLFVVEGNEVHPLYHFDLGEHAIPTDISCKDVYERIDYSNRMYNEKKPFAGMLRYFSVYDEFIYFVCLAPGYEITLCSLNTKDNTSKLYQFDFSNENIQLQPFLKIIGDKMILSAIDKAKPTENPYLITLKIENIK